MIDDKDKDKKPGKQSPVFARKDAKAKHKACITKHSTHAQHIAQQLHTLVSNAYVRSKCYLTARKNFISVKVAKTTQLDRAGAYAEINAINAFCTANNIEQRNEDGNVFYQIV